MEKTTIHGQQTSWEVDIREISPRRITYRELDFVGSTQEKWGEGSAWIPADSQVVVSGNLQAIDDGILVHLALNTSYVGECVRCLDEFTHPILVQVDELVAEPSARDRFLAEGDEEAELMPVITGSTLNIYEMVRDALIIELPFRPLCEEECQGICSYCGEPWRNLPSDHRHEEVDPRWAALQKIRENMGGADS